MIRAGITVFLCLFVLFSISDIGIAWLFSLFSQKTFLQILIKEAIFADVIALIFVTVMWFQQRHTKS